MFWAAAAQAQQLNPTGDEIDAFVLADGNKDQQLSRTEFRTFVQAMAKAGQSTARQIRFFGAYDYAFNIADADGNGILTPMEMRQADDSHRAGEGG
ncbi:hypothetical protein [Roseovarius faecimaris]|nr:hypothetical protein [Roseovarius faecimaris]